MTETVRRLAPAAAALALLAAGCASEADPAAGPSSSGTVAAPEVSPSVDPTASSTPGRTRGKRVRADLLEIRVPRSYQVSSLAFTTLASEPRLRAAVRLNSVTDMPDRGLDSQAELAVSTGDWAAPPRRLPDVTLDGVTCYHLRGRLGNGRRADEYGGYWDGGVAWVAIESDQSPAQRDALVALVLAGWRWR